MEIPPEYDEEHARERLREEIMALVYDADAGHLEPGEERTVTEPSILSPQWGATPRDDDFEWTFAYQGPAGDQYAFIVTAPDGVEEGEILIDPDADDVLREISDVSVPFHRREQLSRMDDRLDDVGDKLGLPMLRYLVLLDSGRIGIVSMDPPEARGVDAVVPRDEISSDDLEQVFEDWQKRHRAKMEEKYGEDWEEKFGV